MYVIIELAGRQYSLEEGTEFLVSRIPGKEKSLVKFKNVLFAKEKQSFHIGAPYVKEAYVTCEVLSHPRAKKVVAFKYKRRKSQKCKTGHRQDLTRLKVKEIHI